MKPRRHAPGSHVTRSHVPAKCAETPAFVNPEPPGTSVYNTVWFVNPNKRRALHKKPKNAREVSTFLVPRCVSALGVVSASPAEIR